MNEPPSASALLEDRLARIEQELLAAAGDASLCAISRSAGSVPHAKYLEGRTAVVRDLRRLGRREGDARVRAAVPELLAEWRAALAEVVDRDRGPDWRAYRAGGVDELEHLVELLSGPG